MAEAVLWALARLFPMELAPSIAAAIPVVAVVALAIVTGVARPSIGETAIAVDVEGGLRDRLTSALALAGDGATPEGDRAPAVTRSTTSSAGIVKATSSNVSGETRCTR